MIQSIEKTACTVCDDLGWEYVQDEKGARRARKCEAPGCDYWARKRGYAPGVPDDAKTALLSTYGMPTDDGLLADRFNADALRQAQFFLDGVHPGLYIHGGVGSGKTLLACAILNELHRQKVTVRFQRVQDLLNRLMPGGEIDAVIDQATSVAVLALDDIGASQGTDFARRMLLSIFEGRQDRSHRTIWTSNLDLDELTEFFENDKRLPSRIGGAAKIVTLDGPDYRLRKMAKRARG